MFFIGADVWPGLSKLIEEAGEVVQVCGKLIATGGEPKHYDGTNLEHRLADELGDLLAAAECVITHSSPAFASRVLERYQQKLQLFNRWHVAQRHEKETP
jgi:NTP pyrophosphatase (non-canonical NTP hydrolase)